MPDINLTLLERAQVASPCPARWEDMTGDDKTRHCRQCDLHVHNLSAMTAAEAQGLLAGAFNPDGAPRAGRFCAGYFRRADGTIITRDCPVGVAALKARARRAVARVAAAIAGVLGAGIALARLERQRDPASLGPRDPFILGKVIATPAPPAPPAPLKLTAVEPFRTLDAWMHPPAPATPRFLLGEMVCPPPPPPPPPPPAPAPGSAQ